MFTDLGIDQLHMHRWFLAENTYLFNFLLVPQNKNKNRFIWRNGHFLDFWKIMTTIAYAFINVLLNYVD